MKVWLLKTQYNHCYATELEPILNRKWLDEYWSQWYSSASSSIILETTWSHLKEVKMPPQCSEEILSSFLLQFELFFATTIATDAWFWIIRSFGVAPQSYTRYGYQFKACSGLNIWWSHQWKEPYILSCWRDEGQQKTDHKYQSFWQDRFWWNFLSFDTPSMSPEQTLCVSRQQLCACPHELVSCSLKGFLWCTVRPFAASERWQLGTSCHRHP